MLMGMLHKLGFSVSPNITILLPNTCGVSSSRSTSAIHPHPSPMILLIMPSISMGSSITHWANFIVRGAPECEVDMAKL